MKNKIYGFLPAAGAILLCLWGEVSFGAAPGTATAGQAGKGAKATVSGSAAVKKEAPKPVYTGESSFVVEAGKPVSLTLTATGDKPMVFGSEDLPPDLRLQLKTGVISGTVLTPGTYTFTVTISNRHGEVSTMLKIEARAA